ncbi:trehalose synthase [Micromonospora coxensis]|uniref:Trehalose synthase n=1 Tax=Micromonospora coxensis TaxID=356852 RepID=A0A1C5HDC7_9ACTN|nr:trehalose synthase [Micromonospora coxensis]
MTPPPTGRGRVLHVNATATGGGVAELLHGLVPAQTTAGTPTGWAVIAGDHDFFRTTKNLHHLLHGTGDAGGLDARAVAHYRAVLAPQARWLAGQVAPGDLLVLHDPQTLGLAPALAAAGARVIWHCHIGTIRPGADGPALVWDTFATDLAAVEGVVTTLPEFAPPSVAAHRRHVVPPAVDPDGPKNRPLSPDIVAATLAATGLVGGRPAADAVATVEQDRPLPPGVRVVAQVARWDPLKDMTGVVRLVPDLPDDVHLVLAGVDPTEIPDDPEGRRVLDEVRAARDAMAGPDRARVHLLLTSLRDETRAALLINAVQRRADVVVHKSLEEGFGLAVTEAMVKRRAVVAADVGGIRRQIEHDRTGLLVDPTNRAAVLAALRRLLAEPSLRHRLGAAAADVVAERFTMARLVRDYRTIVDRRAPRPAVAGPIVEEAR